MENQKFTDAIKFAKEQVCDNAENAALVMSFVNTFLAGLKQSGQDKGKKPGDYIVNGAIIGYALRYLNEQAGSTGEKC